MGGVLGWLFLSGILLCCRLALAGCWVATVCAIILTEVAISEETKSNAVATREKLFISKTSR